MIKIRPKSAALGALCLVMVAPIVVRAQPKAAASKNVSISAPAYRAQLQKALDDLKTSPPAAAGKIIGKLDAKYDVRRADGQIQSVSGNFWSKFGVNLGPTSKTTPTQARRARQALQLQIRALDEWTQTPVYQSADARKIVADLAASGQIRVGPLWWQKAISDAWAAVQRAWKRFIDWLISLFPTPTPLQNTAAPSDKWLWALFYLVVAAILAFLLYFALRAFGWNWFGGKWGRARFKNTGELENEDAALLQLPPDELLSRAARYAAQGNFREALRHRYLSLLLDLDARGVWRYDARRTNWEHIAALNRSENGRDLVAPLADLTKRFDRVRYGGAACDDDGWRRFDGDARDFETRALPSQKTPAREVEMAR